MIVAGILRTVSVTEALLDSLRADILDGVLAPGESLTETDVSARYGVSRPTARAVINQLVQVGLLRRPAHRPAHVPVLTRSDVEDLFLVRLPLELEAVRLVSGRRSVPAEAARAVADVRDIDPDAPHSAFVEADLRFHRALVDSVGSPRLSEHYARLGGEIHLCMVQSRGLLGSARIAGEHQDILVALERATPAVAVRLMRAHLVGARDLLAESASATGEFERRDHTS